jgi:hypothetical protein
MYWVLLAVGYGGLGIAFLGTMLGLNWLTVIGAALLGVTFPWRLALRIRQGRQVRAASQTGTDNQKGPSGEA